jgi:low affinity Fe/Cu permease
LLKKKSLTDFNNTWNVLINIGISYAAIFFTSLQ